MWGRQIVRPPDCWHEGSANPDGRCEPPRRETGYTKLPRKIARRALRRPRLPRDPQGLHEGLRESQPPARTHANSKLLATQSGDPFCFALKQMSLAPWPESANGSTCSKGANAGGFECLSCNSLQGAAKNVYGSHNLAHGWGHREARSGMRCGEVMISLSSEVPKGPAQGGIRFRCETTGPRQIPNRM